MAFKIFYDGKCPLCEIEIDHLKRRNKQGQLSFVDITGEDFSQSYPHLDWQTLDARIHGEYEDGRMIVGFDVMHEAWSRVGFAWLYKATRLPGLRFIFDKVYLLFAKHRHTVSYWITRKKRCDTNCGAKF
jgi:predicted DCC family thiol-disulfide oxidoreductase YuxK